MSGDDSRPSLRAPAQETVFRPFPLASPSGPLYIERMFLLRLCINQSVHYLRLYRSLYSNMVYRDSELSISPITGELGCVSGDKTCGVKSFPFVGLLLIIVRIVISGKITVGSSRFRGRRTDFCHIPNHRVLSGFLGGFFPGNIVEASSAAETVLTSLSTSG